MQAINDESRERKEKSDFGRNKFFFSLFSFLIKAGFGNTLWTKSRSKCGYENRRLAKKMKQKHYTI